MWNPKRITEQKFQRCLEQYFQELFSCCFFKDRCTHKMKLFRKIKEKIQQEKWNEIKLQKIKIDKDNRNNLQQHLPSCTKSLLIYLIFLLHSNLKFPFLFFYFLAFIFHSTTGTTTHTKKMIEMNSEIILISTTTFALRFFFIIFFLKVIIRIHVCHFDNNKSKQTNNKITYRKIIVKLFSIFLLLFRRHANCCLKVFMFYVYFLEVVKSLSFLLLFTGRRIL